MATKRKRPIRLPAPYLRRVWLDESRVDDPDAYPFCLPFLKGGFALDFDKAITITGAGAQGYDEAALDRDLAQPFEFVTPALNQVGQQLAVQAKEWFLAEVVRIGMTDGPLSDSERQAAQGVAADLGMTQAQAYGVISMTERAAASASTSPTG